MHDAAIFAVTRCDGAHGEGRASGESARRAIAGVAAVTGIQNRQDVGGKIAGGAGRRRLGRQGGADQEEGVMARMADFIELPGCVVMLSQIRGWLGAVRVWRLVAVGKMAADERR